MSVSATPMQTGGAPATALASPSVSRPRHSKRNEVLIAVLTMQGELFACGHTECDTMPPRLTKDTVSGR